MIEYGYGKALNQTALQHYLCVGKETARQIGRDSGAAIRVGKKWIYNRTKIDEYIDRMTGSEIVLEASIRELQRQLEEEIDV